MKPRRGTPTTCLAGYLGGEPGHDVQRRLDELHRRLQHHRHAEAARADARDGQPARTDHSKGRVLSPLRIHTHASRGKIEARSATYPMIQMMAPTMETRTASSANGSPSSQPSGRHSPPSPPQQHITHGPACLPFFFFENNLSSFPLFLCLLDYLGDPC